MSMGQCWACGQKGRTLVPDPLVGEDDDTIKICEGCAVRRGGIRAMYEEDGTDIIIQPALDPKRDNPDWLGNYTVVKTVPDFSGEFDDL